MQGNRRSRSDMYPRANQAAKFCQFFIQHFYIDVFLAVAAIVRDIPSFRIKILALLSKTGDIYEIVIGRSHTVEKIYRRLYEKNGKIREKSSQKVSQKILWSYRYQVFSLSQWPRTALVLSWKAFLVFLLQYAQSSFLD